VQIIPKYRNRVVRTRKFFAHDEEEVCNEGDRVSSIPCFLAATVSSVPIVRHVVCVSYTALQNTVSHLSRALWYRRLRGRQGECYVMYNNRAYVHISSCMFHFFEYHLPSFAIQAALSDEGFACTLRLCCGSMRIAVNVN
jgi:Ribosomal protein S17